MNDLSALIHKETHHSTFTILNMFLIYAADIALGFILGIILTVSMLSLRSLAKDVPFDESDRSENISPDRLADAALTFLLQKMNPQDFVSSMHYEDMNGETLPVLSGYSGVNALTTYVKHGGAKSEAIKKYLSKNLSSEDQINTFFGRVNNALTQQL